MGYPPAEGELDQATAAEAVATPEPVDDEPDHVAAQLDALAGMMARQDQALSPEPANTEAQVDAAPEQPAAEDVPEAPTAEEAEPATEEPQKAESEQDAPAATEGAPEPEQEIDPLTAPLAAVTGVAAATAPTTPAKAAEPTADLVDAAEPAPVAEVGLETAAGDSLDELPLPEAADVKVPREPGTTATILRPAQLLIVATAALNLILVGLNAVLGTTSGSMSMVVLGAALITLGLWTGAAVTFLHWVSRAHAHVAASAASRQRHGSSMSLIGWFIPIAGFLIGYRVLQDLWTGSDPSTRGEVDAPPAKVRTIDLWLLGIVTAALFGYVMPVALGESALWGGLSALGLMVAALSLASTMGAITAWQGDEVERHGQDVEAEVPVEAAANAGGDAADTLATDQPTSQSSAPEPVSASVE